MRRLLYVFNNLPIVHKLLLTSVIPIVALILLSLVTYRSVQTFSEDEEQLNNIYLVQRRAAEYMRLIVDMETGFRGYVISREEKYLAPYRVAQERVLSIGESIEFMVQGREGQRQIIETVQRLVKRLITEKDQLIQAVREGHQTDALHYIEEGRGRTVMSRIRQEMGKFDRLEQDLLNDALAKLSQDRSSVTMAILGGGSLALILMVFALYLIARSITGPLVALAKAVSTTSGGSVPCVPVLDRKDEIGNLTRVMSAMSMQLSDHIARVEKSEAELRMINQSLSESESKYRSIVDHAPFGIFTTKGTTITFSNRYNRILAGLNPDEEGDPEAFRDSIHPEDRDRVLSEFAEAVKYNRPYETIFRFLHKDGTVRKVLSRRIPIMDADGQTIMYQGFNIDITALDQMQSRLARAERLATLGQVAAGIAHEIRNPLVGIGSTVSLLLDETAPSDPRRADLEVVLSETRRLDRIVDQIVEYARPRALAPMLFSLSDLVQETLSLVNGSLTSKRIEVVNRLHPNLSPLMADRDQIKQVLLNVIHNALDAMPEGGRLGLTAFDLNREGQPGVMIQISDNGVGIQAGDLPHVFEPFFTTGKRKGTGLGLAICRNIIDAHRGHIVLDSKPGSGTIVRIWLPLKQPSPSSSI